MQEGQLLMTQADRDRLVALKKVKKKLITQREASAELELSVRQVQGVLGGLEGRGGKAGNPGMGGETTDPRSEEQNRKRGMGKVRPAGVVLYRQGEPIPDGAEAQTR